MYYHNPGDKSSARNNWIIWEAVDLRIVWLWNAQFLNVGVGSMQANRFCPRVCPTYQTQILTSSLHNDTGPPFPTIGSANAGC